MRLIDKVNPELKKYIISQVFPMYELNGESHGIEHINQVIKRTFEITEEYEESNEEAFKLDYDVLYVAAAYHDIGEHIDRKQHHIISGNMMFDDTNLDCFLSLEDKKITKEAIEDHRASNEKIPRSIYGRIILTADRNNSIDDFFKRRIGYCLERHPEYTLEEVQEEVFTSSLKKFGKDGYALNKPGYMPSKKLETYLETINDLLQSRQKFDEITSCYFKEMSKDKVSSSSIAQLPPELSNAIIIGSSIKENN